MSRVSTQDAAHPGGQATTEQLPGVVLPDWNRESVQEQGVAAWIDLNAPQGVGLDFNQEELEDRGSNVESNEAAQALIDASEPVDGNSDYIGDRLTADAINTPSSVYLDPPLDFKDPPDLEEPEPPVEPEPDPPLDAGILRRVEK